jgi:phytoene dehydrogenase-like protein
MKPHYDVIVIGGGHNGLVAGAYLAKAGRRVLILESREILGGAAASEALWPGFCVNAGSPEAGLLLPEVIKDLKLHKQGLTFLEPPAYLHALQPGGPGLTLWRDLDQTLAGLAAHSPRDAAAFERVADQVAKTTSVLAGMRRLTPPALPRIQLGELASWAPTGLKARRMGGDQMMELLRVLPMPAWELLEEWFETPLLQAALGMGAVSGTMQGPWAAGTALMMMYQAVGAPRGVLRQHRMVSGGMGKLIDALAQAARSFGAEIRVGTPVSKIEVSDDAVTGVLLSNGECLDARQVLSTLNPAATLFHLVGPDLLETEQIQAIRHIRYRGSTARIHLALSGLPDVSGVDDRARLSGRLVLAPSLKAIERAYDDAKYGRPSSQPCLEVHIPTLTDPSLASTGQHLMSIDVRYAPYDLSDAEWAEAGPALADRALDALVTCMPDLREKIEFQENWMPPDLEARFGLPEGSIYHGQMSLDQMLILRPTAELSRYETSIRNLYLAGSSSHPGGGVTAAPGYNAARVALKGDRS